MNIQQQLMRATPAELRLVNFLRDRHPQVWQRALQIARSRGARRLDGTEDDGLGWVQIVAAAVGAASQFAQQRSANKAAVKQMKLQIKAAKEERAALEAQQRPASAAPRSMFSNWPLLVAGGLTIAGVGYFALRD